MNPVFFMGAAALLSGIALSRQNHSALGWLGEDLVVPVPAKSDDYDPRRYNRTTFIKTHIAKKFWGSAVLSAQSAQSMRKLADRVRSSDAKSAKDADVFAAHMEQSSQWSADVARENNATWVGNRKLPGAT